MTRSLRFFVLSFAVAALAAIVSPRPSQALTLGCSASISTVDFGTVDVLPGQPISTNATVTVTCGLALLQPDVFFCITLPPRSMGPSPNLAWEIYGPVTTSSPWSNAGQIRLSSALIGLGQSLVITVPATILGSQSSVPPGNYSQTLSASVVWSTVSCSNGTLLSSGSSTFTFMAKATIAKSCNISATDLNFPAVGDLNSVVDGSTTLNVQCTQGTSYMVGLNGGISGATDPTARLMTLGPASIKYGLYQNAARSLAWSSSATVGGTGNTLFQPIAVYGRVPVQPTPPPGTYSDTIIASVTY